MILCHRQFLSKMQESVWVFVSDDSEVMDRGAGAVDLSEKQAVVVRTRR